MSQLVASGLLDKRTNQISPEVKKRLYFEQKFSLPTPGLFVKGCLDECNICDEARMREIELELEHSRLKNYTTDFVHINCWTEADHPVQASFSYIQFKKILLLNN